MYICKKIMETIFESPLNIKTFEGQNLVGVVKTVVDFKRDIITFYIGERMLVERNKGYIIVE